MRDRSVGILGHLSLNVPQISQSSASRSEFTKVQRWHCQKPKSSSSTTTPMFPWGSAKMDSHLLVFYPKLYPGSHGWQHHELYPLQKVNPNSKLFRGHRTVAGSQVCLQKMACTNYWKLGRSALCCRESSLIP